LVASRVPSSRQECGPTRRDWGIAAGSDSGAGVGVLRKKRLSNDGNGPPPGPSRRTKGSKGMDEKNYEMAHRRMVSRAGNPEEIVGE